MKTSITERIILKRLKFLSYLDHSEEKAEKEMMIKAIDLTQYRNRESS